MVFNIKYLILLIFQLTLGTIKIKITLLLHILFHSVLLVAGFDIYSLLGINNPISSNSEGKPIYDPLKGSKLSAL